MKKNEKNELMYEMKKKQPLTAGVLSFLIVGFGQGYNGDIGKGLMFFFGSIIMWMFLLGWIVWIWSIIDAANGAEKKNKILALELDIPLNKV